MISKKTVDASTKTKGQIKKRKKPQVWITMHVIPKDERDEKKFNQPCHFYRNGQHSWTSTWRKVLNVTATGSGPAYCWTMTSKGALVSCSKTAGGFSWSRTKSAEEVTLKLQCGSFPESWFAQVDFFPACSIVSALCLRLFRSVYICTTRLQMTGNSNDSISFSYGYRYVLSIHNIILRWILLFVCFLRCLIHLNILSWLLLGLLLLLAASAPGIVCH